MAASGDHRESFLGDLQAFTQHIKATYEEAELEQNATCKSYLQVQQEGARQVSRNILHYSLDLNLAPALQNVRNGFRVHAAADMPPAHCVRASDIHFGSLSGMLTNSLNRRGGN